MKFSIATLGLFVALIALLIVWFNARGVRSPCYMTNDLGYWPGIVRFSSDEELEKWQQSIGLNRLGTSPEGIDFETQDLLIEPMDSFCQVTISSRFSNRFLFIHGLSLIHI